MKFFVNFLVAFIISSACTPVVIYLAKRYKLVDDPRNRFHPAHTHKGIIPRAGGVALFIGILLPLLIFIPFNSLFISILLGSLLLVIVGILDDVHDISPYIRLATNAIAAILVVISGAGIPYITNPLGGIIHLDTFTFVVPFMNNYSFVIFSDIFAFLWIMWTMNIIGWSAGVDGQMPGFVSISALVLGLLSMRFAVHDASQVSVTMFAFIVSGAFAGFLPWNVYPQKIMPGYSGKTLAGFLLALLAILSYGKVGTALLVLGVPMMDAVYTLIRRIGSNKSPVLADRGHLHHRLLDLGWSKRKIALFYWSVSAILGAVALTVTSQQKFFAFLVVAVGFGGFLLWVAFFSQFSNPQDQDSG